MIDRQLAGVLKKRVLQTPVVALLGSRQVGKTTLARQFLASDSPLYFDLEDPVVASAFENPMSSLAALRGLVVIDEAQRCPQIFPVLRVLADRAGIPARFLILGSASPELSRQAAESLAATGAAIFVGSAFHPSQRVNPRKGFKRWAATVALRIGLLVPLYIFAPSTPIAVVTVLAALSIPAFGASQFSRIYGYSEPEVAAANKYGWYVGAVGLIAALLLVHYQ
jgi:hypothetical protein